MTSSGLIHGIGTRLPPQKRSSVEAVTSRPSRVAVRAGRRIAGSCPGAACSARIPCAEMRLGVPKETAPGERRVALVPEAVGRLAGAGFEVAVERGAGAAAAFPDEAFAEAGATLVDNAFDADAVVKVQKPSTAEAEELRDGSVLVAFLQPLTDPEGIQRLGARGVIAFAMESIPRITRAQPMDALSSQATVSGYKAVLLAAERLPRFFPMLMTAAGTVAPAKVLVLGAGVAGPQAIPAARPAPRLIPAAAVRGMRPGSVVVDVAAEAGGNCELTVPGEIVEREGVTIVGLTNLPSTMPYHASQLYARNVAALLQHLAPGGELELDWADEITAGACVTRKTEVAA